MNTKLNRKMVRELWSRTYNTNGKPDWSHLFPYYHDDIIFQDSIQRVEDRTDFEALCNRLANQQASLTPIPRIQQAGQWSYSPAGLPMAFLTGKLAVTRVRKEQIKNSVPSVY